MTETYRLLESLTKLENLQFDTGDSYLDRLYCEDAESRDGQTNPYYRAFYLLAKCLQPGKFVEIGLWRSYTSAHVASACPDCICVGIDPWAEDELSYELSLGVEGHYPNFHILRGYSIPEAAELYIKLHPELVEGKKNWHRGMGDCLSHPLTGGPIDLLFIDGWHEGCLARREWEICQPRMSPGAVVVCDDISGHFEGMPKFWEEISKGRESLLTSELHPGIPMGIVVLGEQQDIRWLS